MHWYFAQLDNNGSHDINKKELKPFKRYLKKKAKPKKCARRFTDYCDLNKDRAISLHELKGCLGVSKEGKKKGEKKMARGGLTRWSWLECGPNLRLRSLWDQKFRPIPRDPQIYNPVPD